MEEDFFNNKTDDGCFLRKKGREQMGRLGKKRY